MRELSLLRHITEVSRGMRDERILLPPGDDMAMVALDDGGDASRARVLAAIDQVVGGRHFDLVRTPIELVGRKTITRNLSDIAAMAARPLCALAAATLPPGFGEENAQLLFAAMRETAARYDCPLVGGDIAIHECEAHPLICTVAVLATPAHPTGRVISRAGARAGDGVYVTGALGGSWKDAAHGRHLTFEPRIREALALHELLGERLHAMIDLSDGLGRDAAQIAWASSTAIELDAASIPAMPGCTWRQAVSDGEDYELLFTAAGEVPGEVEQIRVTHIGTVKAHASDHALVVARDGDALLDITASGWEHAG